MWNNYFNVYLYHTYKWQRILNHCDIDGMSYCRILLLTNTRTYTNTTTFSVENRLLGNEKSGRGFALSDADTLPQSNQASFSLIFAPFFDTSFQSARLNFSHWNNTEKNCTFSLFETSVNGNVTFAYIMTFHFHSIFKRLFFKGQRLSTNHKMLLFVSWCNKYAIIEWPLFDAPTSIHGIFTSFSISQYCCLHFWKK